MPASKQARLEVTSEALSSGNFEEEEMDKIIRTLFIGKLFVISNYFIHVRTRKSFMYAGCHKREGPVTGMKFEMANCLEA